MFSFLKVVLAVVVFVGGFFSGRAILNPDEAGSLGPSKSTDKVEDFIPEDTNDEVESIIPAEARRAPPPITWDGNCPSKPARCPRNFQGRPPVILVSFDGFHPDYLKRGFSPTMNKIAKCGAHANFIHPVFPSKTFPNHFSIVTGLNPPSHGIIDNSMYDPVKRKLFKLGSSEMSQPYWYQKDPIWVTAEQQGKKTASFFWPGSDVKISGITPTYNIKYNPKLNYNNRVDQILAWLELPPASRPSFITLYVNQPDNSAHATGTKSQRVNQAIGNMDQIVTRLFAGLQVRNLTDCVDVIILSDHGMSDVSCKLLVDIQNFMDVSDVFATMGPFGRLRPKGRHNATAVAEIVSKLRCKSRNMRVYPKEQLPVRMHYVDNARIEPIILDMDSSWTVVSKGAKEGDSICSGAAHGYDNLYPDMKALFMAHGPSFIRNSIVAPIINTEIYELLTELIGITPNPNNGTRGSLHYILKSPQTLDPQIQQDPPAVGKVPTDELEYNYRVAQSNCACSQANKQVDIDDMVEKKSQHLPFGVPYSAADNSTLRVLYNNDYILGFDLKYRIPMWTSFTLDGKINNTKEEDMCWTGDARIPISDVAKCSDYDLPVVKKQYIIQRPLYSPGFSDSVFKEQASHVTNAIPKSMNYTKVIEKKLNLILSKWASQDGQLNVMMGPAFDLLGTGIRPDIGRVIRTHENNGPLIVPTHIFVVATWCSVKINQVKDCNPSKLMAQGFLLPNKPYTNNCESGVSVIEKNVARVVDIENLTGVSFYSALPTYDAIRLRTTMSQRSVA